MTDLKYEDFDVHNITCPGCCSQETAPDKTLDRRAIRNLQMARASFAGQHPRPGSVVVRCSHHARIRSIIS
jgi:hypothetical protein